MSHSYICWFFFLISLKTCLLVFISLESWSYFFNFLISCLFVILSMDSIFIFIILGFIRKILRVFLFIICFLMIMYFSLILRSIPFNLVILFILKQIVNLVICYCNIVLVSLLCVTDETILFVFFFDYFFLIVPIHFFHLN